MEGIMTNNQDTLVGVDEFTLVLQFKEKVDVMTWQDTVDTMLYRFLELSHVESIFGELYRTTGSKVIQGYNEGIFAEHQPFYFVICWHEYLQDMGIAVKFSAHAWAFFQAEYEEYFQEKMDVSKFLKMVQSDDIYTTRLSRIDFTADYKNHGLNVNRIYQKLKDYQLQVRNWQDRRVNLKMSAIEKDRSAETIYLGSRKANSHGILRIYDKKEEQISNHGFRLGEALATTDWIRFEAVMKGKRAHQITTKLLNEITSDQELQRFIAQMITDKYTFFDVEKDDVTDFTSDLLDIAHGKNSFSRLRSESPRDNSLKQSIRYLTTNAGLFPAVYKIQVIYGDDGVKAFWQYLQDKYEHYIPNKDTDIWLGKHWLAMSKQPLKDSL